MYKKLELIAVVLAGVILTVGADVLLKESGGKGDKLILGTIAYAATAIIVAAAFRISGFGQLFILWEALTVMGGLVIAAALFREPLTLARIAAAILAILAVLLSL
ncbi:MAG: hypothetical protein ABSG84_19090 [Acidobacteriaceae bacterium]|jgi:multidrug transporter EmrE-like cation transporter